MENFELIKQHREGTGFCSVQHHMRTVSPTYEQIIAKGKDIVPDILKYLRDENGGMSVMLLLWDILKISPYQPEEIKNDSEVVKGFAGFKVSDARQAWLDWGARENLI